MNIATVQLIMGGLGIFSGLLIALLGPGRSWIRWPLALATGAGVAITGWPKLWLGESSQQFQLYQSLLLASIVVFVALLTIMLLYPSRRTRSRNQAEIARTASPELSSTDGTAVVESDSAASSGIALEDLAVDQEPGRDAIALELDQSPDAMIANQQEHAMMHLLPTAKKPSNKTPSSIDSKDATEDSEPLLIETTSNAPSIDQLIEKEFDKPVDHGDTDGGADVVSLAERRVKREGEIAADSLDLSDSEELYQAMRDAEAELELPEDSTWLDEEIETKLESRPTSSLENDAMQRAITEEIEDAEILAINEVADSAATTADLPITEGYEINTDVTDIDFASDELALSDDIAVKDVENIAAISTEDDTSKEDASKEDTSEEATSEEATSKDTETPKYKAPLAAPAPTLEAALVAQRHSIRQLSSDTDTLTNRLQEWQDLSDTQEQTAWQSSLRQGQTVQHQQQRILAENNFRSAAVELIRTQRDVMRQLMTQIGTLGEQREEDLASLTALQETSMTQQRLARQAALLARKAASDKQTIMSTLRTEQTAHARTKSAAKRAMDIARDAVDKLAKHEQRLGITGNRQNPDNRR